ncbi:MAG: hypothetical protein WC900_01570 [Oscillospiraceae bacterium]|jgi:hypothetical protein
MLKVNRRFAIRHLNSFFQEIIIVILFFSLSCAIIVQVFAKAYITNLETEEHNGAVLAASSFCEVFSVRGSLSGTVELLYGGDAVKFIYEDSVKIPLDENFCFSQSGSYYLTATTRAAYRESGNVVYADLVIFKENESLFEVTTSAYQAKGAALE